MSDASGTLHSPDCCYVDGCDAENEVVLHLAAEPPGYADLCRTHALALVEGTPLTWSCECLICEAARRDLALHDHPDAIVLCVACVGRWLLVTASGSTHLLDLGAKTIQRVQDLANASPGRRGAHSVRLRRDGDVLPLFHFDPIRLGEPAALLIGEVDHYAGYVSTTRVTTPVRSVVSAS